MRFREAKGEQIDWLDARPETFSNFDFADQHFFSHNVLRRILSLARKLDYQSMLWERIDPGTSEEYQEEAGAMSLRRPDYSGSEVHRLSFFRSPPKVPPGSGDFLGYVVVKTDHVSEFDPLYTTHIQEAVIHPPRSGDDNNFIHCGRDYRIKTGVGDFDVHGVLYAQQNGFTSVCAHVALRSVLSCVLPDGDITCREINEICGVDHQSLLVGTKDGKGRGLMPDELEKVIRAKGLQHCFRLSHEPNDPNGVPYEGEFQKDLYGLIESRGPALLAFELEGGQGRHVIPVIGHTFNEDTWVVDANRHYFDQDLAYYPSENWLSSYVVHDDNFGPLHCLPRHYLQKKNFRLLMGGYPIQPQYDAPEAEAFGLDALTVIAKWVSSFATGWLGRFGSYALSKQLVLRTLLLERTEYLSHVSGLRDRKNHRLDTEVYSVLESKVPDQVYVIEASAPELFPASRQKFGEVVLDASVPPTELGWQDVIIMARLPSLVLFRGENGLQTCEVGLSGHTPLFSKCPT